MFTWLESTVTLICKINVGIQQALYLKGNHEADHLKINEC